MEIAGKISYCSQEPWLFSASVKQNILFGDDYDEERYQNVVEVCALTSDFNQFPYGDKTLVGEKGKSLSGGQKARINLARCIYKKSDIYLLDDPLSAVDASVGKYLYERCIRKFLSDKICVLITHQFQYLNDADKIIIMKNGQIQIQGTYNELKTTGMDFAKLLEEFGSEESDQKPNQTPSRQTSVMEELNINDDKDDQTIEKENVNTGYVTGSTYWTYLKAGGSKFSLLFMIFLYIVCQLAGNGGEYFVTYWVNLEEDYTVRASKNLTTEEDEIPRDKIIYFYTAITLGLVITALSRSIAFMLFFANASQNLHDFIFSKMIVAAMKFFNSNPSGRILNRFSKDIGAIDEYIPGVISDVVDIALILVGTIALSAIVNPWFLIPAAILMIVVVLLRVVYIRTSRDLKRLEAITKSPVLSHVSATVNGLITIRAFSVQKVLIKEFDDIQDNHSAAWYLFLASNRCFGLWLDVICGVFIAVVVFFMLTFKDDVHGGDLGLVVTQLLGLIGTVQWGMRQWSEMENQMTSVERVIEYTKLETDPNREKKPLPIDWPQQGFVEFRDLKLKYKENEPYVLQGINISIKAKEKVGVVGRTGAGKSSLISALFQLYNLEGSILIDDVDVSQVPLIAARAKISIIPQEPVLFSGTMRKNLDPFAEYSDDVLWEALDQVEMKNIIADCPSGLHTSVSEGGTNYSVGQRQLVCLARALVRRNKILVLDEATANVDVHTDSLIQKTIRNQFANCTVITIAHRLRTVMDSNRILVMDGGKVVEFDHPYILLQQENGFLWNLIKSENTSAKYLENIAKDNYLRTKANG